MATKYCASCKKTVSREWPHSCYDADALERRREAERKVVDALVARIDNYLGNGGFWNPEYMEHDKVRDLLMDVRVLLAAARGGA